MTDKNFALHEAAFRRALVRGTPEFAHRQEYPGVAALAVCRNKECVKCAGGPAITTYWLCEKCKARSPNHLYDYRTHAPPKQKQSAVKIQQGAAAAFLAWALIHPEVFQDERDNVQGKPLPKHRFDGRLDQSARGLPGDAGEPARMPNQLRLGVNPAARGGDPARNKRGYGFVENTGPSKRGD